MYKTQIDFEELDEYYCLSLDIVYDLYPEEKRTRDYPGCPGYIDINEVIITKVEDQSGKSVSLSKDIMDQMQDYVNKMEWDVIISESLQDQEDYLRSEYYDRKRDEARGC